MICYRDMTFCPFWKDCIEGKECGRAITQEVIDKSRAIGLPISKFLEKPDCFNESKATPR